MKKVSFYSALLALLLSIYNVLYKYVIIEEKLNQYNTSFGNAFVTTTNVTPPYIKIFLYSLIFLLIALIPLLKKKNKINILIIVISLIISIPFLFINKILSIIIIFVGIIIYLYSIYKDNKSIKQIIINIIIIIFIIIILHLISY